MIRITFRDLQWRRRRFVVVVMVASLAFGLALTMAGVTNQLRHEGDTTVELFAAERWVVAAGVSGPFTSSQLIDARLAQVVATRPGVSAASPLLVGRTTIGERDVNIIGYDPDSKMLPSKLVEARSAAAGTDGLIADERLGRDVGQRISLGGSTLTVEALVRDTSFFFSAPTVFLPIDEVQQLLFAGREVASAIVVRGTLAPADVAAIGERVDVIDNGAVRADFKRVIKSSADTIGIVNVLLWIMAVGIVAAIMYVSVLERTRDFATLKAMGTTNRALLQGLVGQSAVVTAASAVAAVGVAAAVSPTFSFPVAIAPSDYVQLLIISMIVGMLASLAGVRKITKIDPALAFGSAS